MTTMHAQYCDDAFTDSFQLTVYNQVPIEQAPDHMIRKPNPKRSSSKCLIKCTIVFVTAFIYIMPNSACLV